jgi:hypothetical protein
MTTNPNGVAVTHIIATGFNLWSRNEKEALNAVGMGHVFGMNHTNFEIEQVFVPYGFWITF